MHTLEAQQQALLHALGLPQQGGGASVAVLPQPAAATGQGTTATKARRAGSDNRVVAKTADFQATLPWPQPLPSSSASPVASKAWFWWPVGVP